MQERATSILKFNLPQEIYQVLINEWPLQKNSQQVIQFCQHYFINHSISSDSFEYYLLLKNIKNFINSSYFESSFKNLKISILPGELSYVRPSDDFKELNDKLDKILAILLEHPSVQNQKNNLDTPNLTPSKRNFRDYWAMMMPLLILTGRAASTAPVPDTTKASEPTIYKAVTEQMPIKQLKSLLEEAKASDSNAINQPDPVYLNTPLHMTSYFHQYDISALLLEYGADINARNKQGLTCLQLAASEGDEKLIRLLLKRHADKNIIAETGGYYYTAAQIALATGHIDIAKLILEYNQENELDKEILEMIYQAEQHIFHNNFQEALDIYLKIESFLSSEKLKEYRDLIGWTHASIAKLYEKKEYYWKAIQHGKIAVEYALARPTIYYHLASNLGKLRYSSEALSYLNQGLNIFPDNIDLLSLKANILFAQLKNYKEAFKITEKLKIYAPELPETYYIRGIYFIQEGEYAKAFTEFNHARQLAPNINYQNAIDSVKYLMNQRNTATFCENAYRDEARYKASGLADIYKKPFIRETIFREGFFLRIYLNRINC